MRSTRGVSTEACALGLETRADSAAHAGPFAPRYTALLRHCRSQTSGSASAACFESAVNDVAGDREGLAPTAPAVPASEAKVLQRHGADQLLAMQLAESTAQMLRIQKLLDLSPTPEPGVLGAAVRRCAAQSSATFAAKLPEWWDDGHFVALVEGVRTHGIGSSSWKAIQQDKTLPFAAAGSLGRPAKELMSLVLAMASGTE